MKKLLTVVLLAAVLVTVLSAQGASESAAPMSAVERIKKAGVIKVATGTYVPFEYRDENNNIVGYDIDFAQLVADKLGVKLEVSDMVFQTIIPAIEQGQYDFAIAAMYDTAARREVVLMSDSYYETGMILTVPAGNPKGIRTLADCAGLKVGVKAGATSQVEAEKAMEQYGVKYEIVGYEETIGCVSDLEAGRVDVVVNDLLNQLELCKTHPMVEIVGEPFTHASLACAVKMGDDDLLAVINEVIAEYKADGTMDALTEKWLK